MSVKEKATAPVSSVGADGKQPLCKANKESIADLPDKGNLQATNNRGCGTEVWTEKRDRIDGLETVSMTELYDTVYPPKIPIVDGLIYAGTYLFVGAPKVGKSYKSRICSIIEEYGELELDLSVLDKKEKEKAILEEYQVFSNPSYIFFKGNVDIHYVDGNSISVTPDNPIAILSEAIVRIEMIKVNSNRIVTVENLTSYNRINDNKSTFIYLSGYHNTAKQRFLKKIAENNSGVSWFHFGDIDPDGYYILKNLIEKTGISFVPLYMDVQQLINCKQYCKPLEKNDMVKANSLLKFHFYDEVMEFMLANNCKLEQEIISWLYERN